MVHSLSFRLILGWNTFSTATPLSCSAWYPCEMHLIVTISPFLYLYFLKPLFRGPDLLGTMSTVQLLGQAGDNTASLSAYPAFLTSCILEPFLFCTNVASYRVPRGCIERYQLLLSRVLRGFKHTDSCYSVRSLVPSTLILVYLDYCNATKFSKRYA
jgi:hypothetical protein